MVPRGGNRTYHLSDSSDHDCRPVQGEISMYCRVGLDVALSGIDGGVIGAAAATSPFLDLDWPALITFPQR